MRSLLLALLPATVLAAPSVEPAGFAAPLFAQGSNLLANKYIVKLKESSGASALDATLSMLQQDATHVYQNVFQGFAATLDSDMLKKLRSHPDVEYIQQDSVARIATFVDQKNPPRGLPRISYRKNGSKVYTYDDSAGDGTCAYVLDTGVDDTHPDFDGHAKQVTSFIKGQEKDGHGHGTHCAGTIGSKTYGVAKKAKLFGVKVLNNGGNGEWSEINAGLDYVAADHKKRGCKGTLINLSIDGDNSPSTNEIMAKMVKSGIFIAAAAGNSNKDVGNNSPGSEPMVCTVGASDEKDNKASFSNYGKVVDIFAPGNMIVSTWPGNKTNSLAGTSMATPHVVGIAAYLWTLEGSKGGQELCERLQKLASKDILKGIPSGTVNLLAFNNNPSGNK